jgi:copper(I)-binding protein
MERFRGAGFRGVGAAFFSLAIAACGGPAEAPGLEFADAWVREAPPGMNMQAAYGLIRNETGSPVTLTGFASDRFEAVSLHETVITDGRSRMRAVRELNLEPGGVASLAPGGMHLMLEKPDSEFRQGAIVDIRIQAADGRSWRFEVPVERR